MTYQAIQEGFSIYEWKSVCQRVDVNFEFNVLKSFEMGLSAIYYRQISPLRNLYNIKQLPGTQHRLFKYN